MNICKYCGIEKEDNNFGLSYGKLRNQCRECRKIYHRAYYLANPEKFKYKREVAKLNYDKELQKRKRMKWRYGILPEEFNKMIVDQGRCCAICKSEFNERKVPFIDHCHVSSVVRGVLCHYCNTGLGYFKDSIENLSGAIKYMKEYREGQKVLGKTIYVNKEFFKEGISV